MEGRTLGLEIPTRDRVEGVCRQAETRPAEIDAGKVRDLWILPEEQKQALCVEPDCDDWLSEA